MAKIFCRTSSSLPLTTRIETLSLSLLDLSIWRCCQRRGTPAGSSGSSWAARCPAASAARLEQRSAVAAASGVAWASGGAAGRRAGGAEQAASAHDEHAAVGYSAFADFPRQKKHSRSRSQIRQRCCRDERMHIASRSRSACMRHAVVSPDDDSLLPLH